MPRIKGWQGPDVVLHCPRCDSEFRISLHNGLEACPHDENLSRGDCEICQRDALRAGELVRPAAPLEPPLPPPPPQSEVFRNGNPWHDPVSELSPQERAEMEHKLRTLQGEIPPGRGSEDEG